MSIDSSPADLPNPEDAATCAQFLAAMRALFNWAATSYAELERRALAAGERLPRSTIANALSRGAIPREKTIATFVRACGGDERTVKAWLAARRRIAGPNKVVGGLADAVEAWLTVPADTRPSRMDLTSATRAFGDGRLAQAVAEADGDRWIGLHRRRRPARLRQLVKRLKGTTATAQREPALLLRLHP
ncbi:hypothetical protein [Catelliglobosispora koreensis]|uniref:hypothetical protein n=1 Tax=Catelliglobosispora koreensis TaxID=129052 RepID=UPI0003A5D943|nr:hypothetical protein [Catelliglobosispora koreensis]